MVQYIRIFTFKYCENHKNVSFVSAAQNISAIEVSMLIGPTRRSKAPLLKV